MEAVPAISDGKSDGLLRPSRQALDLLLHIKRHFSRHGEGLDRQSEIALGPRNRHRAIDCKRSTLDDSAVERFEDRIGIEGGMNPRCGPQGEGLSLSEREKTRHIVDFASCEKDGLDR